jgi:hypothetical protein
MRQGETGLVRTLRAAALAALCALAFLAPGYSHAEGVAPQAVCTITINSADEKEAFLRRLPRERFRFFELVELGRRDWLRASCGKPIRCDVLVVSGHFNAGDAFYSDRMEVSEYLDMDELERASCSGSCPTLFSQLKEVYLFGCKSLDPDASKFASSRGDGGRERMRRIFANVPVIYGFSSKAPIGATAATLLERHFDGGAGEIATGRASARLLRMFAGHRMASVRGVPASGIEAARREQVCRLLDERTTPASKLAFVHAILGGDRVRAGELFEYIDGAVSALTEAQGSAPDYLQALAAISADDGTRERFLAAARAARQPGLRARMITLAQKLGWLSPEARRAELAALVNDLLGSSLGFAEVELACSLVDAGEDLLASVRIPPARAGDSATAAILACLGDTGARARILAALASGDKHGVQAARAYLRHRQLAGPAELRALAGEISRMPESEAQILAFDTLGRLRIEDPETIEELARAFAASTSIRVQAAIAEILLRSAPEALAQPGLAGMLREKRVGSRGGDDLVEAVIRRLQAMPRHLSPVRASYIQVPERAGLDGGAGR